MFVNEERTHIYEGYSNINFRLATETQHKHFDNYLLLENIPG